MLDPIRAKWNQQKSNARRRKIVWRMTFEEWWKLWSDSGKWELRGRNSGQYHMSRIGDRGPYAVGNVRIILGRLNLGEKTYQHTEAAKRKIGAFHKGHQRGLGKTNSEATRQKISASNKGRIGGFVGKHHSEETKALKRRIWRNQYGSAS